VQAISTRERGGQLAMIKLGSDKNLSPLAALTVGMDSCLPGPDWSTEFLRVRSFAERSSK
jgi:hypothetical protein